MKQTVCFHCGGKLNERGGKKICTACGADMSASIPDKAETLLAAAYRKLRLSKFFEAEQDFEDIISKYPQIAHGYWGLLLAKYYVKYESTGGKKLPVCYAPSEESVHGDGDYQNALKYADEACAAVFKEHAERIESFRREWTDKVMREEPYDIFISCKENASGTERTQDSIEAQSLCEALKERGYRVFYGRESLSERGGKRYEPYLYVYGAIATAKVMLVYGSNVKYITSSWLQNEWSRYYKLLCAGKKAQGSLLVAFNCFEPAVLPEILSDAEHLDARSSSFYADLIERISELLPEEAPSEDSAVPQDTAPKEDAAHPLPVLPAEDAVLPSDDLCKHVPQIIPGKAPACGAPGWTESSFCKLCGKTLKTLEWIPATDHVFGEWRVSKKPTCTAEGEEESVCTCGERKTRPIPKTDHSFGEWRVAKKPTCTKEGAEESVCACCGEKRTKPIPAAGHSFGEWRVAKKATCTKEGAYESVCVCGEKKTKPIPATGHVFGEWRVAKKATCTEDGAYERVCACKKKETKPIPSRGGHITDGFWKTVKSPMPGEDGLKAQTCIICGAHVAEEKIPALFSKGLSYTVNSDQKTCTVRGIGTCTDLDIYIPQTIDGYQVTSIGRNAFKEQYTLKSVVIPKGVTDIAEWAFLNCNKLMKVTLPDTLTAIGPGAFWNCSSMKSVHIPISVRKIGSYAFRYCTALTEISLPLWLDKIEPETFADCKSLSILVLYASHVTSIGNSAFKGCTSLSVVKIPDSVRTIGKSAFMGCTGLKHLDMTDRLQTIEESAFSGCTALAKVTVPSGIPYYAVKIEKDAFAECKNLTEMGLQKSASAIGEGAFRGCAKLSDLSLSVNLKSIGSKAFSGCTGLPSIRYGGTKAQWKQIALDKEWRKESPIRTIECDGGAIKFLFS